MDVNVIIVISGLAFILPLVVLIGMHLSRARKIYQDRQPQQDAPPILKLLVALVLGMLWILSLVLPLISVWQVILGNTALEYCLLVTYSANRHVLTGKPHDLLGSPLTFLTTMLAVVCMLLGYLSRDNLANPLSDYSFTPTLLYCLYYSLVCSLLFFLYSLIFNLYWQSIRQSDDLTYQTRRAIGLLGITFSMLAVVIVETSIILSIFYGPTYRLILTVMFYCLLPGTTLYPIAQAIPQPLVDRAVQPLERYLKRHREEALCYLHQRMLQLVPGEQMSSETFDLVDVLAEISGARRIIWTQEAHSDIITAADEAEYLFDLLNQKKVFEKAGKHKPPRTATPDVIEHNIAAAKCLQRLEAQSSAPRRIIYDTGH